MLKSNRTVHHSIFSNSTLATKQLPLLFVYWSIHKTLLYIGIHQLLFQTSIQFFRGFALPQKQPLECSIKKSVLKYFNKFTGKNLCRNLFFNKVAGLRPEKKRLRHKCFLANFVKYFRTPLFKKISGRLLLFVSYSLSRVTFKSSSNICDGTFCDYSKR